MTMFQYLVLAQDAAQDSMGQMDQASGQALWMTYRPLVIARWIHFASAFVLFGSSFFWFYMPREHSLAHPGQLAKALAATTIMLRIAAPVAAISGVAWLALVLINVAIFYVCEGGGSNPITRTLCRRKNLDRREFIAAAGTGRGLGRNEAAGGYLSPAGLPSDFSRSISRLLS